MKRGSDAEQARARLRAVAAEHSLDEHAFERLSRVLDLVSTESDLGKPAGHDIEEGVYTLPILLTLEGSRGPELRSLLVRDIEPSARDKAIALIRDGDAIKESIAAARDFADRGRRALGALPDSPGVVGLTAAADYLLDNVEAASA